MEWKKKERKKREKGTIERGEGKNGTHIPPGYAHAFESWAIFAGGKGTCTTCGNMALGNRTCSLLLSAAANGKVVKYLYLREII